LSIWDSAQAIKVKSIVAILLFATLAVDAGPYSRALNDATNSYDAPIPGYIGPDGEGFVPLEGDGSSNYLNPVFAAWATHVVSYVPADGVWPEFTNAGNALGPATGDEYDIVALGDLDAAQLSLGRAPGQITLGFDVAIANLEGADFAVFENVFVSPFAPVGYIFGELAYVEVGSTTNCFARFPSHTLIAEADLSTNRGRGFTAFDPTGVYNLAGKHVNKSYSCWGTPFNLDDLTNHANVVTGTVDLMDIHYIRIVDIPGNGAFYDGSSPSNGIYDAWVTTQAGGFDLEAVGVINFATACDLIVTGSTMQLQWMAHTNRQYQVQWTDSLSATNWYNAGEQMEGDNTLHVFSDTNRAAHSMKIYRIVRSYETE